jgi:branched-chain amino acid transport system ATP-binding protein
VTGTDVTSAEVRRAEAPGSRSADRAEAILVAEHVRRSFGGVCAADVDHLDVPEGRIVALIGPNGAGKTTLFNVLTGFEHADSGRWTFQGRQITGEPPYQIAREGMVRTFQLARALARMSVLDNMKLAAANQRGERFFVAFVRPAWRAQERQIESRALELLEWLGLARHRDDYAGTLSGGERKLLELGRAVMAEPALLMLDEPTSGVNPALKQELLDRIGALRVQGVTVLFVEHDMEVVTRISDGVVCMAQGRVIAEGAPADVVADSAVIDAYLGTHHGERA